MVYTMLLEVVNQTTFSECDFTIRRKERTGACLVSHANPCVACPSQTLTSLSKLNHGLRPSLPDRPSRRPSSPVSTPRPAPPSPPARIALGRPHHRHPRLLPGQESHRLLLWRGLGGWCGAREGAASGQSAWEGRREGRGTREETARVGLLTCSVSAVGVLIVGLICCI
jgi:hypothetical protein